MTPAELLHSLRAAGAELWIDGPHLRYSAPPGIVDGASRIALAQHKSAVMTLLAAEDAPVRDPAHRGDPFPLTAVQASYLVGRTEAFAWGGVGCQGYAEFEVCARREAGRPTEQDYRRAWHHVVTRHDMLRCVVHPDGYQRIELDPGEPDRPLGLTVHTEDGHERITALRERIRTRLVGHTYTPGTGPLFDLVVTLGPDDTVVHFCVDLLIADFVGIAVVIGDFERCLRDRTVTLPDTDFTFRDYLLSLARAAQSPAGRRRLDEDRRYWSRRLDTLPGPVNLPLLSESDSAPVRFDRRGLHIDVRRWTRFTRWAGQRALTPAAALLTAFGRALGRYGDSDHFTVMLTTMNRRRIVAEVDTLVGDFTGTSVLELDVRAEAGACFAALARRTATRLFEDLDHGAVSGVEVLRQAAERHGTRDGQSPVVFTSTLGAARPGRPDRPLLRPLPGRGLSRTPQVLLDCQVFDADDGGVDINWDSRAGAIPDEILDRALADFDALLRDLGEREDAWDRPLPEPAPPSPAPFTPATEDLVHTGFLHHACARPEAVAIHSADRVVTYGELAAAAWRVAAALRGLGVGPRDRVTVCLEAGPAQIAALLGVLLAGGAYVPLDPRWPHARIATVVRRSAPVASIDRDGPLAELLAVRSTWTPAVTEPSPPPPVQGPDDPAYVLFTSGTTGTPKGVVMSHRAVVNTLRDINRRCDITRSDAVLAVSRYTFDLSVYNIFGMFAAGGRLVFADDDARPDPDAWLRAMREHGVTVWNSVPAQMRLLLDRYREDPGRAAAPIAGLRRILLSGDWIPVSQPAEIAAAAPEARAWSLGGATEAAIWSIQHRLENRAYRRSVPYGTALDGQTVRVLTHRGEAALPGQIGEIHIGGAGLAIGYLDDEVATAAAFVTRSGQRWYRTGDFGRCDVEGVIELLGRRDHQVEIHGHRIELAEVEAALERCAGVGAATAAVLGDRTHPVLAVAVTAAPAGPTETRRRDRKAVSVRSAAEAAHREATATLSASAVAAFQQRAESVALRAMSTALAVGAEPGRPGSFDDIRAALALDPAHEPLVRRWLAVLVDRGFVRRSGGEYTVVVQAAPGDCARDWERVREIGREIDYGDELLAYVGRCLACLPELLSGSVDPLALLFPRGSTATATAAYRDNLLSRYLHAVLEARVAAYAADFDRERPLRILEVGAGVGGTSTGLLDALRGLPVRYTFTDISPFFLNTARDTFAADERLDFRLFDLDTDPGDQGLAGADFDLVVCANVLHNAADIEECLRRLHGLLAPGGALAVIDSTCVNPALMISMEFKDGLDDAIDLRRETGSPFLTFDQWNTVLDRSPFGGGQAHPPRGHVLERLGQHLFWCVDPTPATALRGAALLERVRADLPDPMVPRHLAILPAMPLTANGKVDRARVRDELARGLRVDTAAGHAPEPVRLTGTQARIAAVWAHVLGLPDTAVLTPHSDFFAVGGDSLLLAQAIGRLRREIPEAAAISWDELLRGMVADPTLAGAERALLGARTTADDSTPAASPLVHLGTRGPEAAREHGMVVLVHDGSGGLAPYDDLLAALRHDEPDSPEWYGLRRVPGDGYHEIPAEDLFTVLAERYARAVAALRPARVDLVGYCLGGLLAVDIARHLDELGVTVGEVSAVSSYRLPVEIDDDDILDYCFAQIMGVRAEDLGIDAPDSAFAEAFGAARAAHPRHIPAGTLRRISPALRSGLDTAPTPGRARMAALADSAALGEQWTVDALMELRATFAHGLRAVARGAREPYLGDIRFLRQRGRVHFLPTLDEDMTEFWQGFCLGTLTITDIEGTHFDCLAAPHAAAVADHLTAHRTNRRA